MSKSNAGKYTEKPDLSYVAGGYKMVQLFWKIDRPLLNKLNICLVYYPVLYLGALTQENENL